MGDTQLAAACLLAFAGFLQYDELSNIQPCNIKLDVDHITIAIPKSKGNQLHQGDEVVIARTNASSCPITMLEQYMIRAKIQVIPVLPNCCRQDT